MGFVAPVVSVIGGIAGIASQNSQARAQREQINASAYQAKVNQLASEQMLEEQQVLARREYQISTLGRLQAYSQAQAGLAAQEQIATLKNQQDDYRIQYDAMQQRGALDQQQQQMERQRTDTIIGADQKIGVSASKEGATASALDANTMKQMQAQTAEDRKRISAQAVGRMSSTSSSVAREGTMADQISTALSQGLDTDRTAIQAYIQQLGEEEQLLLAERIGLNDNAANMDTISANIRLAAMGADGALQQNAADLTNTKGASNVASRLMTNDANSQARSAADAYRFQDYSLGVNRDVSKKTGQSVQSSYQSAAANTKGAGFMDYLALGVNTYGAVSPLLQKPTTTTPVTKKPETKFSGFVPSNNA